MLTPSLLRLLSFLNFPTCLIDLVPVACCAGTSRLNTYVPLAKRVVLISNLISMTQRSHSYCSTLLVNMAILSLPIIFIHLETLWLRDIEVFPKMPNMINLCVPVLCRGSTASHSHNKCIKISTPPFPHEIIPNLALLSSSAVTHLHFQCISLPLCLIDTTLACCPAGDCKLRPIRPQWLFSLAHFFPAVPHTEQKVK